MWIGIIVGIALLTIFGFVLGIFLSFASNIFKVESNPLVDKVLEVLPGANCGACGYPGCTGYAEALCCNSDTEINLCSPGGKKLVTILSDMLGKTADYSDKFVAKVFCMGDDKISRKDYEYNGEDDCLTLANLFQGEKSCKYGCVGKGDCMKVCPVHAIKRDALNRIWVESSECVGCKRCVSVCPKGVIHMVPVTGEHFVACSSHDNGKFVREVCNRGCIACNICEKVTGDVERIAVVNNLATIRYEKTTSVHQAMIKCPTSVIIPIETQKAYVLEVLMKEENKKKAKTK